ncbi:hypothetical protein CE91St38_29410 [Desulfovibrionaceae bacterium]|nr:hypothetical protein CE91St38_29410 [Desulfovibrionaceae bacterium]
MSPTNLNAKGGGCRRKSGRSASPVTSINKEADGRKDCPNGRRGVCPWAHSGGGQKAKLGTFGTFKYKNIVLL